MPGFGHQPVHVHAHQLASQHSARRFAGLATCQMAVCTSFGCSCRLQLLRCAYVDSCMLGCIKVSRCAQVQRCPLGIDKRALWWCYHHAGTCAGGMLACVALIWWQRTKLVAAGRGCCHVRQQHAPVLHAVGIVCTACMSNMIICNEGHAGPSCRVSSSCCSVWDLWEPCGSTRA